MSITSETLIPLVPYLRRHARLLTGSKEVGDEYVRLCLELVVAEPERLEQGDLRVQLFKAFYASWNVINNSVAEKSGDAISQTERLEQGLASLAPIDRQVLLLFTLEEFACEEISKILRLETKAIETHLVKARQALHHQVSIPVLIIEDEPMVAMELSGLVEDMGLEVSSIAARQDQAVIAAHDKEPGLVLADIQLQDSGDGIEAAHEILQRYSVPIVFVTGFPDRLLTGTGLEPAFVVAKPFRVDGLKATIAQALSTYRSPASSTKHRTQLLAKLRQITAQEMQDGVRPTA